MAADLAKYASTPTTSRRSRRRRHSVSVCETPPSGGRKKEPSVSAAIAAASAAAAQSRVPDDSSCEPVSLPPIRGERGITVSRWTHLAVGSLEKKSP